MTVLKFSRSVNYILPLLNGSIKNKKQKKTTQKQLKTPVKHMHICLITPDLYQIVELILYQLFSLSLLDQLIRYFCILAVDLWWHNCNILLQDLDSVLDSINYKNSTRTSWFLQASINYFCENLTTLNSYVL